MNRGAEEDQDVGRENNDGRRIEPHIPNPLLSTHTLDVSNAAVPNPEPVQVDIALSPFYFMELLIPNPRHLPAPAQEDTSHGGQVAHGGRGQAGGLEDAPPSYEEVARTHGETAEPPSYEDATNNTRNGTGHNNQFFNQGIRNPVANSDPEPTNHPIEDERFSCCCQNGWQYGPVWTCVIRCLMILFLYFLLKCLVFFIHYIKNHLKKLPKGRIKSQK